MKDFKTFTTLFEQYAYTKNYSTALSELLDYFLLAFKFDETGAAKHEAILHLSSHPQKALLVLLFNEIGTLSEGFKDPIGMLFEQCISKGQKGQFFTPDPLASLMAVCVGNDDLKDGQSVYDPACGSGRMLLAAAKINRHLRFYGADIDPLCCKISLVNMLLNSLTGEVTHMNSLTNEFYTGFKTGSVLRNGYYYPYYKEFTDPHESYMWLRPVEKPKKASFEEPFEPTKSPLMRDGIQGNLFDQ